MRHLAGVLCGRHQKENGIKVTLFRNHAVVAQIVRQNRGRHAKVFIGIRFGVNSWRREQEFARVDKVLRLPIALKVVPFRARFKSKEAQIVRNFVCCVVLPSLPFNLSGNKGSDVFGRSEERFTRFNRHLDAVIPKASPSFAFMHFCVHIERGEKWIEGRGGSVHHKSIIHALVRAVALLSFDVRVLLMNLRSL